MTPEESVDIPRLFAEETEITKALAKGARQALIEHKALGYPAVFWIDDQVVWIAPEDIVIPPEP